MEKLVPKRLTTNSTWEVPAHVPRPLERVLCRDHMREPVLSDGFEQCVKCGSARVPVEDGSGSTN